MSKYHDNKKAAVGSEIECPVCHKKFKKAQYSQAFCSRECKDRFWNANLGNVKPSDEAVFKMEGWLARDKNGKLRLWVSVPQKEMNFDHGASWGRPCEMGEWIKVDKDAFPSVKWEDLEPARVEIVIKK